MNTTKYVAIRRCIETGCEFVLDDEVASCPGLVKVGVQRTAERDHHYDRESPVVRIVKVEVREVPE